MSTDRVPLPGELPSEWRELGDQLGGVGALVDPRKLIEVLTQQLENGLKAQENAVLSLQEAAKVSGYSAEHLRKLVGKSIPNAGRKHAPKVRAGDLPRKPRRNSATLYDASADAARLMSRGKGA
jgi:hypothetical protein